MSHTYIAKCCSHLTGSGSNHHGIGGGSSAAAAETLSPSQQIDLNTCLLPWPVLVFTEQGCLVHQNRASLDIMVRGKDI